MLYNSVYTSSKLRVQGLQVGSLKIRCRGSIYPTDTGKWYKPGIPKLPNIYQYTADPTPSALACLPSHSIVKPKAQKGKAALDKERHRWEVLPDI